jgi:hypothetical protein
MWVTTSSSVLGSMGIAQQTGWGELPADHVDAQRPAGGAHGGGGPLFGLEEIAGIRQERLPIQGELGSASRAGEQPDTDVALQRGDALGYGLLGDRDISGGLLELPRVRDGHEGVHGIEVHAARL